MKSRPARQAWGTMDSIPCELEGVRKKSGVEFLEGDGETAAASVQISRFRGTDGVEEYHLLVQPRRPGSFESQLAAVIAAYDSTLRAWDLQRSAVLRRFFCSDLQNQANALQACSFAHPAEADEPCAVSYVEQAPAPPARVALWAYHLRDPHHALDKRRQDSTLTLRRGGLTHHWTTGITCPAAQTSYDQTRGIFEQYDAWLTARGLKLADHVMRTWLFVRDIDTRYAGLVSARKVFFATRGLTPETHFIASSGIGGGHVDPAATVSMDVYAIAGVRPEQIEYLAAPDHLSPTHLYGVTFERGIAITYRDRKHVILSGTASIDYQGNILHPGDVSRQLDRTLDNIQALLGYAGAGLSDMCQCIVYVRDPNDFELARQQMRARVGKVPTQVVLAPVCRPGWLIEVEALAILPAALPDLPPF